VALSIRRHEPVGVVTAITPYNGAIIMAFQKLIPALMAGNSVLLRPSPLTPISSLVFGAAADAVDLPAGVLSVIVEDGAADRI
jgi:acyl-CoA reductase-like NAD-dependent aldehyde dehydrogenase